MRAALLLLRMASLHSIGRAAGLLGHDLTPTLDLVTRWHAARAPMPAPSADALTRPGDELLHERPAFALEQPSGAAPVLAEAGHHEEAHQRVAVGVVEMQEALLRAEGGFAEAGGAHEVRLRRLRDAAVLLGLGVGGALEVAASAPSIAYFSVVGSATDFGQVIAGVGPWGLGMFAALAPACASYLLVRGVRRLWRSLGSRAEEQNEVLVVLELVLVLSTGLGSALYRAFPGIDNGLGGTPGERVLAGLELLMWLALAFPVPLVLGYGMERAERMREGTAQLAQLGHRVDALAAALRRAESVRAACRDGWRRAARTLDGAVDRNRRRDWGARRAPDRLALDLSALVAGYVAGAHWRVRVQTALSLVSAILRGAFIALAHQGRAWREKWGRGGTAMLVLLTLGAASACAQPGQSRGVPAPAVEPVSVVVVLDGSGSRAETGDTVSVEHDLAAILGDAKARTGLPLGSTVDVVAVGAGATASVVGSAVISQRPGHRAESTRALRLLTEAIRGFRWRGDASNLFPALHRGGGLLAERQGSERFLYVASDFRQVWRSGPRAGTPIEELLDDPVALVASLEASGELSSSLGGVHLIGCGVYAAPGAGPALRGFYTTYFAVAGAKDLLLVDRCDAASLGGPLHLLTPE